MLGPEGKTVQGEGLLGLRAENVQSKGEISVQGRAPHSKGQMLDLWRERMLSTSRSDGWFEDRFGKSLVQGGKLSRGKGCLL